MALLAPRATATAGWPWSRPRWSGACRCWSAARPGARSPRWLSRRCGTPGGCGCRESRPLLPRGLPLPLPHPLLPRRPLTRLPWRPARQRCVGASRGKLSGVWPALAGGWRTGRAWPRRPLRAHQRAIAPTPARESSRGDRASWGHVGGGKAPAGQGQRQPARLLGPALRGVEGPGTAADGDHRRAVPTVRTTAQAYLPPSARPCPSGY